MKRIMAKKLLASAGHAFFLKKKTQGMHAFADSFHAKAINNARGAQCVEGKAS